MKRLFQITSIIALLTAALFLGFQNAFALDDDDIENYYGFELIEYPNGSKICKFTRTDSWCNVHDQIAVD